MQIRFTKGFVRQSMGADGKPAFMVLLVVDGEVPPELGDEQVIAGSVMVCGDDVIIHVEEKAKTGKFGGCRADQIICSL